jgi:hypothetical protein
MKSEIVNIESAGAAGHLLSLAVIGKKLAKTLHECQATGDLSGGLATAITSGIGLAMAAIYSPERPSQTAAEHAHLIALMRAILLSRNVSEDQARLTPSFVTLLDHLEAELRAASTRLARQEACQGN